MQVLSLVWGILSIFGMFIGFLPLLGWLNWGNIPFAGAGLVISIIATANARGYKGFSIAGIVMCSIAIIIGVIRLNIGCGII